ncbi:MAG: restriction endonuclease subunit S [Candidatus Saccharimonadaceae bacterium]|nr:restriction endonuclease subunit S [Candidatus Saccharimonadaceae bacterium]
MPHKLELFFSTSLRYYEQIDGKTIDVTSEIPFEIPHNWSWVKLGFVAEVARGGSPRPIENYLTDSDDGINWIKIGDVASGSKFITQTNEKIIPAGLSKTRFVHAGDFLLSNSMSFGRPYILKISGCIHDGWLVLHPNQTVIVQDFLFYALSSSIVYSLLANLASGSTVKNLKSDSVKNLWFPIPPLTEQQRIASAVEQYSAMLAQLE